MTSVKKYGLSGFSANNELGKNGRRIKDGTNGVEIRNAVDNAYAELLIADATQNNSAVNKKQMENYVLSYGSPTVVKQMNGSEPAGNDGEIAIVTTAFSGHAAKTVWRYNTSAWVQLTVYEGMRIVVATALTGGTDTYNADWIYIWDVQGATWVGIGAAVPVTAVTKTARASFQFDTASPFTIGAIPDNAIVTGGRIKVTTPFNGVTESTLAVGITGTTSKYASTSEINLAVAGIYEFDCYELEATGLNVIGTYVRDTASAGVATILLDYSII